MNHRALILAGFVITVGLISYHEMKPVEKGGCARIPFPARIVFTGLTFGLIDLLAILSSELAGVIAIGIPIAAFVNNGFVTSCNPMNCQGTKPAHCGQAILS